LGALGWGQKFRESGLSWHAFVNFLRFLVEWNSSSWYLWPASGVSLRVVGVVDPTKKRAGRYATAVTQGIWRCVVGEQDDEIGLEEQGFTT